MKHNDEKAKIDPEFAQDKFSDHAYIGRMIFYQFALSTFKLVMAITNITYFIGMMWYTFVNRTHFLIPDDNFFKNYNVLDYGYSYRVI